MGAQKRADLAHIFWAAFSKGVRIRPLLNTVGLEAGKSFFPDNSALHGLQELKASGNAVTSKCLAGWLSEWTPGRESRGPNNLCSEFVDFGRE